MLVRERRDDDADALVAILAEVHERDGYPVRRRNVSREWLWDGPIDGAWVAVLDGEVAGHIALHTGFTGPGIPPGAVAVSRLFVGHHAIGHGIGAALLEAVRAGAGDRPLALEVTDASSAARSLYERLGWHPVGEADADWADEAGHHPRLTYFLAP